MKSPVGYSWESPTTRCNLIRIARALFLGDIASCSTTEHQMDSNGRAILLEGSPGVGKTSIVLELAGLLGQRCLRVNLSEQTDVADLIGQDLPRPTDTPDAEEMGTARADFQWCDGPLLTALKEGLWILFDEVSPSLCIPTYLKSHLHY